MAKPISAIHPPGPEVLRASAAFEALVSETENAVIRIVPNLGYWEATREGGVLLGLAIRHARAIAALTRNDLGLLPSGLALVRSIVDAALRVLWLLEPDDDFEREARWLAHLKDEEKMWEHLAKIAATTGACVPKYAEIAGQIREFRLGVEKQLPQKIQRIGAVPSVRGIAKGLGVERQYILYVLLSQYVHGTHYSGTVFRRGLGTSMEPVTGPDLGSWEQCLRTAWWFLYRSAHRFVSVTGEVGDDIGTEEQFADLRNALSLMTRS